jgi:hypothetical protein
MNANMQVIPRILVSPIHEPESLYPRWVSVFRSAVLGGRPLGQSQPLGLGQEAVNRALAGRLFTRWGAMQMRMILAWRCSTPQGKDR